MKIVRDEIYDGDPYGSGDFSDVPTDMQGWRSRHGAFEAVMTKIRPRRVIEVGVWKGKATIHMVNLAKQLGIDDFEFLAIDTWLGSPQHWLADRYRESMRLKGGFPTIYPVFVANLIRNKMTDVVTPLPVPSATAYHILKELGAKADMIHIDAGHEYEDVKADIRMYMEILDDEGVIIGDDYLVGSFPDVTRAFREYAEEEGMVLLGTKGKAILSRHDLGDLGEMVLQRDDFRK